MVNISSDTFIKCYNSSPLILTEGSVGLRTVNEFGLTYDNQILYASHIYSVMGRKALAKIYGQYLQVAKDFSLPITLMTNTRRANQERVSASPYKEKNVMRDYAAFLREVAADYDCESYIGGYIGGKGDGYTAEGSLSRNEAIRFHAWQIDAFNQSDIDFIFVALMPDLEEAIGMAKALEQSNYPYVLSFMVRENGTLPDGNTLHDAVCAVDNSTYIKPLCFMASCVHPRILKNALLHNDSPLVRSRMKGIQANAAYMAPEELDKPSETISSTAHDLAGEIVSLHKEFPLKICGGCCGTDASHLREFAKSLFTIFT